MLYILFLVDRLCEDKANGSRFFSVVVVGAGTTLSVLDLSYLVSYILSVGAPGEVHHPTLY